MSTFAPDDLPAGIVRVGADDRIICINRVFADWIGCEPDAVIGAELRTFLSTPRAPEYGEELPPGQLDLALADGSTRPIRYARGARDADGGSTLVLLPAHEQRAFTDRMLRRNALAQRTQTRLELVIATSIAFAESGSEVELAEILADTAAKAYAAENAVVFLADESGELLQVAGSNPLEGLSNSAELSIQARDLRAVMKVSGLEEARAISPMVADAFERTGVQAMIIAPIHERSRNLGVFAAFFSHPRQFDEQASPLADALAGQAARAIVGLRLQRQLEHAARHDDTTGLPNRRHLEESIEASLRVAGTELAVLFVDLDGFKEVNDELGHLVGDAVLRQVAERLQSAVRARDILSRYGGDEFVIVCEVSDALAAMEMAERIRRTIGQRYDIIPEHLSISASIGVSLTSGEAMVATDRLVRAADQAMYRAKNAGGNRVSI